MDYTDLKARLADFDYQCKCNLSFLPKEHRTVVEIGQGHLRDQFKDALAAIEELEARVAKAKDGLEKSRDEIDDYIRHEYPSDHPVQERYRKRDFAANPARLALAELEPPQ